MSFDEIFEIKEIRRYLDRVIKTMNDMQTKIDTKIGKKIDIEQCVSLGNLYSDLSYYKPKTYYDSDHKIKNQKDIDDCVKIATEKVNEILKKNEEIHAINVPALENNIKLCQAIKIVMNAAGISESYTTYEYPSSRSRTKKSVSHTAGYISDIYRCITTSDGYESCKRDYDSWIKRIADWKLAQEKILKDKEGEKIKATKETEKISKAIQLAVFFNIDPTQYTTEKLFEIVEEKSREKYSNEKYPEGTELNCNCDECGTWIVGQDRCSCGNQRYELIIEGNFFDNDYFGYAQSY